MLLWNLGYFLFSNFLNSINLVKGAVTGITPTDQGKGSGFHQSLQTDQVVGIMDSGVVKQVSMEKNKEEKPDKGINVHTFSKAMGRSVSKNQPPVDKSRVQKMTQHDSGLKNVKSTTVFRGKIFCFSNLFPEERVSYLDPCYNLHVYRCQMDIIHFCTRIIMDQCT